MIFLAQRLSSEINNGVHVSRRTNDAPSLLCRENHSGLREELLGVLDETFQVPLNHRLEINQGQRHSSRNEAVGGFSSVARGRSSHWNSWGKKCNRWYSVITRRISWMAIWKIPFFWWRRCLSLISARWRANRLNRALANHLDKTPSDDPSLSLPPLEHLTDGIAFEWDNRERKESVDRRATVSHVDTIRLVRETQHLDRDCGHSTRQRPRTHNSSPDRSATIRARREWLLTFSPWERSTWCSGTVIRSYGW